jgi:predicted hydrocarbon binding protein
MNTVANIWQELYEDVADRSANYAGELGGMAFMMSQLLASAKASNLDDYDRMQNVFEESEKVLRKYYTGAGSESPFASLYQDSFEAGIERGMKEAV